jgi:tetratricopeptide (TPR) repeat protein
MNLPPSPEGVPNSPQWAWKKIPAWLRLALGMLVIGILVCGVYRPLLPGVFLMDDHRLVVEDNPLLTGEFTGRNIWFQTDFILSNFAFWAQWLAWGNHPGGYHAVNMALHGVSCLLLWRLLVRLQIPGAWVVSLIFAAHPVAVTSVARIAELKNTLSLPFFLLSFWAYAVQAEGAAGNEKTPGAPPVRPGWPSAWHGLSLIAFVLALLSKTSTVMLPPVLLLYEWWRRGRVARPEILRLFPYFLLAVFFGVMSIWFQKYQALAGESLPPESFGERLALAGNIIWFYGGKVLWPWSLNAFYPVWKVNATSFTAYIPLLLVALCFAIGWRFRGGWGRHLIFGLGCFVITLFPVLGFFDAQYLTWFQVSDHLQYLPMIAPLALAVAFMTAALGVKLFRIMAVIMIAGCAILGFQRAGIFSNEETLMRDCLAKNPAAWGARESWGTILAKRHDLAGAVENFKAALACQPDYPSLNLNLGRALAMEGKFDEAEPHFLTALKSKPIDPEMHRQYAIALEMQGRNQEAKTQWQMALGLKPDTAIRFRYAALLFRMGDPRQSETQLRRVVLEKPDLPEALNDLAWQLATSGEDSLRNGEEAVRDAEKACVLTGYKQAGMMGTLAAAYAEAGRFPEAIKTCQQTIELANAMHNEGFSAANRQLLNLYQTGRPYHAPATN